MHRPTAPESADFRPFPAFSLIWAITALVHQLAFTFWTESWDGWVLVLAAVAVVHRPECILRFAILVVASLTHLWQKLPFVPNHILYEGMLHLVMLLGLVGFFARGAGRRELASSGRAWKSGSLLLILALGLKAAYFLVPGVPKGYLLGAPTTLFVLVALYRLLFGPPAIRHGDDWYRAVAPVLRVAVVAMYAWAVVQKLNSDYFNHEVSCATKLHKEIALYFGGLVPTAPWTFPLVEVGSLVFEGGIPLLLCFRRTRLAGLVAAVVFHLWLSIHPAAGIFSFTSLILALLFLFYPAEWGKELQALWNTQLRWLGGSDIDRGRLRARRLVVGGFFLTLIVQAALYLAIARSYEVFHTANRIGFVAFFAWGLWIGACYLVAAWRARRTSAALPGGFRPTLAWIGLVPILLNGAWPWLGGRTQTSFSMYSNLRSEGSGNHLFLKRTDWFKLQEDMVEVLTSAPNLLAPSHRPTGIQQFANLGHHILPWFEFRRLVSEMEGDFEATYTRHGEELSLGRKDGKPYGDPEAFEPLPLLQRKFVWFRRLESLEGPMGCTH
ncbi:MAG TPA: HTTM domain-containing protein [Bacteroidia bacterium]|nr:HTTM domain-containing protein [Bacteroidia bacterium]